MISLCALCISIYDRQSPQHFLKCHQTAASKKRTIFRDACHLSNYNWPQFFHLWVLFAPKMLSISCHDSTLYAKWWCSSFWVLYNFVIGVLFLKNDPLKSGVSDDLETTLKIMLLNVTKNSSILRLICYASSPILVFSFKQNVSCTTHCKTNIDTRSFVV